MKRLMKILAYLFVMMALLILFLPKINLYYAAEGVMKEQNVYIADEEVHDSGFSLDILNAKIFFDKLELMTVEEITLSPWVIYNVVSLNTVDINEGFSDFLPQEISSLKAEHFVYNPLHIKLSGESTDSFFFGDVDIMQRVISLHLRIGAQSEKKYKTLLRKLTKEEGGYYYEYKF